MCLVLLPEPLTAYRQPAGPPQCGFTTGPYPPGTIQRASGWAYQGDTLVLYLLFYI